MADTETSIGFEHAYEGIDSILATVKGKIKTSPENSAAMASPQEVDKVIMELLTKKKLPATQENYNKAITTTAHLVQIGATSPKFASSRQISDYGIDLKAGDLRDACNKVGITVRKYARGIRDVVIKIANNLNIEGNLAKNYKLENPNCDKQDLIWVSDFQTFSDNTSMPEHVSSWLLLNYKARFRPTKDKETTT
jgi:hypothetical protein